MASEVDICNLALAHLGDAQAAWQALRLAFPLSLRELIPNARKWDEDHVFPADAVKKLGELGLLGIAVPA